MQTLGPKQTAEQSKTRLQSLAESMMAMGTVDTSVRLCNCIGPQPGETKCPCQLSVELQRGYDMIKNGVMIASRKYKLVLDEPEAINTMSSQPAKTEESTVFIGGMWPAL